MFVEASKPLPTFKLLMLAFWLFLISSAPFSPFVVPFLGRLWLNALWLSPQLIWAACMLVGARLDLRTSVFNSFAIVFSVVAGYLTFNVARYVHVSSLVDRRGWGDALDVWILTFVYCPLLLMLFFLIWATSKWLGLSALFKTKMALSDP